MAKLESWYRKEYIPRNEHKGTIPNRDKDWEAAKSEVSPYVTRDAVRELKRAFAPKHWKLKGRRKETGDN